MQREMIVLGGNGFLGANLCEYAAKLGIKVVVLDKELGCDLAAEDGQKILRSQILRIAKESQSNDVDVVMMAAQLGANLFESTPIEPFEVNYAIDSKTIQTFESIKEGNPSINLHVSYCSTSEVYGNLDDILNVKLHRLPTVDPTYGRSLYAQEKLITETKLNYLRKANALSSLRIFRPFNVSGKWQKRGVMHAMVKSAVEKHSIVYSFGQTREITFVQDAMDQMLPSILSRENATIDITSRHHIFLADLAKCIVKALVAIDKKFEDIKVDDEIVQDCYISTRGTVPVMNTKKQLDEFTKKLIVKKIVKDIYDGIAH